MPARRQANNRLLRLGVLLVLPLLAIPLPATAAPAVTVESAAPEIVALATPTGTMLQTRVLRPPGREPFPLAIVSHGSPPDPSQRPTMAIPTFSSVSSWLIARGYMVALPLRRGYGQTGGPWLENFGSCSSPDYYRAGLTTAQDIRTVIDYFRGRAEVKRDRILLIGWSAGGWGSLAAASQNPAGVFAVINFAGGRGGGHPKVGNCAPQRLVDAAARYGATARIPTLWLYAANDSFFAPDLARKMSDAFIRAGGRAEYVPLPAFGSDGHRVFGAADGRALWQRPVETFLDTLKH
jgi:dienelactone hydrolase